MIEFRMPSLGADMEAGTLVEWNVAPGDKVSRGDVVAVVETQKGAVDVEIWDDGIVDQLVVKPGTKLAVGAVLALLRAEGEAPLPPYRPEKPQKAPAAPAPVAPLAREHARVAGREKISPAARRRAQELGVDVATLKPAGADAVITLVDVEQAARAAAPTDRSATMRQAIAAAMAKSKREIPHYYLGTTIDVSAALDWLEQDNQQRPVAERVLFAALLLRAVTLALAEFPELNGFWRDGRFAPASAVHLGVGIALRGGGLIAPAVRDAQSKNLTQTMQALADLIRRARSGALRSSELTEATITVTNLGEQGVDAVYGVIYPPQVALVGFGRVAARPWVVDGSVGVRRTLQATLSADHRASVGHRGALFLNALEQRLQSPEKLA